MGAVTTGALFTGTIRVQVGHLAHTPSELL